MVFCWIHNSYCDAMWIPHSKRDKTHMGIRTVLVSLAVVNFSWVPFCLDWYPIPRRLIIGFFLKWAKSKGLKVRIYEGPPISLPFDSK